MRTHDKRAKKPLCPPIRKPPKRGLFYWRIEIGERTLVRQNCRQAILGTSEASDPSVSEDEEHAQSMFRAIPLCPPKPREIAARFNAVISGSGSYPYLPHSRRNGLRRWRTLALCFRSGGNATPEPPTPIGCRQQKRPRRMASLSSGA